MIIYRLMEFLSGQTNKKHKRFLKYSTEDQSIFINVCNKIGTKRY